MALLLLFMAIHREAKNLSAHVHNPSWGWTRPCSAFLFQLSSPTTNKCPKDFPGSSVVKTPLEGTQVWSLVRALGSHIPCGVARKKLNKCPFHGLSCVMFHTHAFGWWFQCLRWFPSTSAFLSARKAVTSLVEKMHVSDKLRSSKSYSAVHHEFNVTVSTTWNKVPFNRNKVMHWSVGNTLWQKLTGT